MPQIIRTQKQIDKLLEKCLDAEERGESKFFGMTFEQGIRYAIRWLMDKNAPHPLEE